VTLQLHEEHDDQQISNMETRRGRIEAYVSADRPAVESVSDFFGMLIQETTPLKLVEQRMRSHGTKIDDRGMN